jgi:DNA-binding NtrC family response regulator/pSer/pThr/pTyr-binding forkhead associated (FHA) protein
MLRLVAYAPDGVRRFAVRRGEMLIGSAPECDLCLPYAGVAQRHARLVCQGDQLSIEDLGSRRGLHVSGRRVRESVLEVLDEIKVGAVTLLVEDVVPQPERQEPPAKVVGEPVMTPERMLAHLARISEWVLADDASRTTSEALVNDVLADFGGGALFLLLGEIEQPGVKLAVATDPLWLGGGEDLLEQVLRQRGSGEDPSGALMGQLAGQPAWICWHRFAALDRGYLLLTALPSFAVEPWSPIPALRSVGHLLVFGLIHHVGWYEPILPGQAASQDLALDPQLVVGESAAMKRVLEQMRLALTPGVHVLLRGEPGVGKEMIARSLHLSGAHRNGPFVVVVASGARPQLLEAELFGAEVPGKEAPVRREGKLLLADGGTLYLDGVEQLPLDVQARLVRFLRSGEVEPAGGIEAVPVSVRLIVGARAPLEDGVARDEFRVDLAYRLSKCAIDVPALRERREDLPLLIQASINRFCHETGKRLAGVTLKTMAALLAYNYPGNLAELDNVVRQLVSLTASGRPADIAQLPERFRHGSQRAGIHVDATSDLDLARLVGTAEQSAIREALRRTQGNKSQAARLLGLSRNGLALKMQRHNLRG